MIDIGIVLNEKQVAIKAATDHNKKGKEILAFKTVDNRHKLVLLEGDEHEKHEIKDGEIIGLKK